MTGSLESACHGAVVLAAGPSTRFGEPKQLLVWNGEPLVRRAARCAVDAGLWPVVVVVGARCEEVRGALAGLPIATAAVRDLAAGLSGSIRLGLARLTECAPGIDGVALLPCDQPLVDATDLVALVAAAEASGLPIAAASGAGGLGLPALFRAAVLSELFAVDGDGGARAVIGRDPARVTSVPLEHCDVDVDTPEDWVRALALGRRAARRASP